MDILLKYNIEKGRRLYHPLFLFLQNPLKKETAQLRNAYVHGLRINVFLGL